MAVPYHEITEHFCEAEGHRTFYLAAGPEQGPPVVFVHGWPELSFSWRSQLPVLGGLGFRAIAPDLRGYGRSSIYTNHADYAQGHIVADMLQLLEHLGAERAIWVGHDWGCATVWALASHHPAQCEAVANLCVPYFALEQGLDALIELVDRDVYPHDEFPVGQWDYMLFYQENFERARTVFEANPKNTLTALFRGAAPEAVGRPALTATIRRDGGWFGGLDAAPELPLDTRVISESELDVYTSALDNNGFFGPDSYYMNHESNKAYAAGCLNHGYLEMPVLFLHARYDVVCETVLSRLADPMRERCGSLTEVVIESGHWMAQEKPCDVNTALVRWLLAQGFVA